MSRALLRRGLMGLAGLAGLLGLVAAGTYGVSEWKCRRFYPVVPEALAIPRDSLTLAWGKHLATAIAKCTHCHGEDLGGGVFTDDPAMGRFVAPNLTSGLGGKGPLSDIELIRAIRHGLAPSSRPLVFMPSTVFNRLQEADLTAIVAYVKSVPPVDRELPGSVPGPVARALMVFQPGRLIAAEGVDHAAPFPPRVRPGRTAEYGGYLTVIGGCFYCHGDRLQGGIREGPPGTPPSADLTPRGPLGAWTEEQFRAALRTGLRPDGTVINPFMPWQATRLMTDDEIGAVWLYLRSATEGGEPHPEGR